MREWKQSALLLDEQIEELLRLHGCWSHIENDTP